MEPDVDMGVFAGAGARGFLGGVLTPLGTEDTAIFLGLGFGGGGLGIVFLGFVTGFLTGFGATGGALTAFLVALGLGLRNLDVDGFLSVVTDLFSFLVSVFFSVFLKTLVVGFLVFDFVVVFEVDLEEVLGLVSASFFSGSAGVGSVGLIGLGLSSTSSSIALDPSKSSRSLSRSRVGSLSGSFPGSATCSFSVSVTSPTKSTFSSPPMSTN